MGRILPTGPAQHRERHLGDESVGHQAHVTVLCRSDQLCVRVLFKRQRAIRQACHEIQKKWSD